MAQSRNRGRGGGGNQQPGRGRGGGGGQIPWNILKEEKLAPQAIARHQRIEDQRLAEDQRIQERKERLEDADRAAVAKEKADVVAKEAKEKASEAEKAKVANSAKVNQTVSAILQPIQFSWIRDPLETGWDNFVNSLSPDERVYLHKELCAIEDEEARKRVIKDIMQIADTTDQRIIAHDRGLIP